MKKEVIFNKEKHDVEIFITHKEEETTHPFLVAAYEQDGSEIVYGLFEKHYLAKKVCQWLMGGFMCTGKLPTREDLKEAKSALGFH